MGAELLFVPLPILGAFLCAVVAALMLRLDLGPRTAAICFAVLFADFALQTLLVGIRFGYGVERFVLIQRVLPLTAGPLLYLGFAALAQPVEEFRRSAYLHIGIALALAALLFALIRVLRDADLVLGISYITYAVLLIRLARRGPDALISARLDVAASAVRWMWGGVGILTVLLTLDTAIALNFALAGGALAPALVTFGSAILIGLLLVILATVPSLMTSRDKPDPRPAPRQASADEELEAKAREMLERSQIYLDPDLTLQRIARRLSVPERTLSHAINASQNMNMSQYVNSFRLAHAANLLRETRDSVSKVMTQSGFLTRSNFYREFQRVYGQTPAAFRDGSDAP